MVTHHAADAAFSTSGSGEPLHNKAGLLGARVSDMALFLFGFSAWWLVPVTARAWLSALAGAARAVGSAAPPRWMFWLGLALLLAASCALEWTRLYRWEALLPGHAGACWATRSGRCRWAGWALPAPGVLWIAMLVSGARWRCAFRGCRWPTASAHGSTACARSRPGPARGRGRPPPRRGPRRANANRWSGNPANEVQQKVPSHRDDAGRDREEQRVAKERQKPLFAELVEPSCRR